MEAFETMVPASFKPEMIQHLANEFPKESDFLGQEGLLEIIENGIEQGKVYGLISKYQYCVFIDSSLILGRGFDTDVQLPWVQEILKEALQEESDKTAVMDKLDKEVIKYQEKQLGGSLFPDGLYDYVKNTSFEEIATQSSSGGFKQYLEKCWPEKYGLTKDSAFNILFEAGLEKAKQYGVSNQLGGDYFTLLMFLLGQNFDSDPKFNWLINILNDSMYDEAHYKLSSLHFTLQKLFEALSEGAVSEN